MRARAVLFDATGVLIEPAEPVGRTYAAMARTHGRGLPEWRLEDAFTRILRRAPPRVFPGLTPADTVRAERAWWRERVREVFQAADSTLRFDDFDAFFDALFDFYGRGGAWRTRPGARAALAWLRGRGHPTGVVSNFDHRLPGILEDLEIAEYLDVISIPSRGAPAKPDPGAFLAPLAELGVDPHRAVFVGHDPELDLAGASAAGLTPLALPEPDGLTALPALIERIANLED